jgi:hypothetical protein
MQEENGMRALAVRYFPIGRIEVLFYTIDGNQLQDVFLKDYTNVPSNLTEIMEAWWHLGTKPEGSQRLQTKDTTNHTMPLWIKGERS